MRLFAAVRPPERALEHLELALRAVHGGAAVGHSGSGVRWTAPENRHLTAAFYGEVSDGLVDELVDELRVGAASVPRFELRLRGAGVFAHRTLWIGVSGDVDGMHAVIAAAGSAGESVGARPDERVRSRPHLTVGRIGPAAAARDRGRGRGRATGEASPETALVHALALYDGPAWEVDEVVLLRSQPGEGRSGGPLYTPVERFPLGVRADDQAL
ncbi:RNA 2',3'-cyclic phosphodiesterase [Cellulomonas cellasea]|uniref:RNA 2',3'-cyclic phosphodiesterase n=1 Tax=Cellulomonas cellasea TaxID=43670 RepID=UPI0025A32EE6|nr:RNA 2',3'-cyclic phosphodiesterase [Cellulomonas cellasea]MDM8086543.1 RNA 2',3'-cyclic phosphodiesterase [Cellulomonas cellasea]